MSDYDDYENNLFFEPTGDMSKLNDCNDGKRGSDVLVTTLEKCQKIVHENVELKSKLAHSEKMRGLSAEYIDRLDKELENTLSRAIRAENKLSRVSLNKDAVIGVLNDVEEWLSGMVGVMNNESAEHNRKLPIGNFEHVFKAHAAPLSDLIKRIKE